MKENTTEIPARLPEERIDSELKRLYTGCMTYYEMFDQEKRERYAIRFTTTDEEIEEHGYFGIMHMEVSGVNLWINEIGLPYLRSKGVI
jgi:hypothetical protein